MEATHTIPPYHAAGMPVAACCPTRSTTVTDPVPLIWWVLYNDNYNNPPTSPSPTPSQQGKSGLGHGCGRDDESTHVPACTVHVQ